MSATSGVTLLGCGKISDADMTNACTIHDTGVWGDSLTILPFG
jgi:hypothetical protein